MKKNLSLLCILFFVTNLFPQVVEKNLNTRKYDPYIIRMDQFPEFLNKNLKISDFYLYVYNNMENSWQSIPFQIDDKISETAYKYDVPNDTVDGFDELVFMIKDLGDSIPDGYWIPSLESRDIIRYEIELVDTLWQNQLGIRKAWAYLFHSSSVLDLNTERYLDYNNTNDMVLSKFYEVGFDAQNGLPNYYAITPEGGGNGVDIVDRIKFNAFLRN